MSYTERLHFERGANDRHAERKTGGPVQANRPARFEYLLPITSYFLLFQRRDFVDAALVAAALEVGGQEDIHQLKGHHGGRDGGAQGHHIGVVVLPGQARAHVVVEQGAADALHFVGGDGDADARGAADDAGFTFPGSHCPGRGGPKVGIVAAVLGVGAEILADQPLPFQMGFDRFLELQCAVVTCQCDHKSVPPWVRKDVPPSPASAGPARRQFE